VENININLNALASAHGQVNEHREDNIGFCPISLTSGHLFADHSMRNEAFPITKSVLTPLGFKKDSPSPRDDIHSQGGVVVVIVAICVRHEVGCRLWVFFESLAFLDEKLFAFRVDRRLHYGK
jgi:hypothetical protein